MSARLSATESSYRPIILENEDLEFNDATFQIALGGYTKYSQLKRFNLIEFDNK